MSSTFILEQANSQDTEYKSLLRMGRTFQGRSLSFSLVGVVIGGSPNGLASGVCLFLPYVSHGKVGFIDIQ